MLVRLFICATLIWFSAFAQAQREVGVAVVREGPQYQMDDMRQAFQEELLALTRGEFSVVFKDFTAQWSAASVAEAMQRAYDDPVVDFVLVVGIAANQLSASREAFPKPTFLPLVFNPALIGAPRDGNRSGRKNLNYLADRVPIDQDLASFQRVIPFSTAVLLTDSLILSMIPDGPSIIRKAAPGVDFSFVGHDGADHEISQRIPDGTGAVVLAGLPRLPVDEFDSLLRELSLRGIATFSVVSEAEVARGALAADTVNTDLQRLARRNALNMQAVMLGERPQDQPVFFDGKRRLTINMETARMLNLSPRFDVLSEAQLINVEASTNGPELDLHSVARRAIDQGLDLAVSELDVRIGAQDVRSARSSLLPQVSVGAARAQRKADEFLRGPGTTQGSTAGVVTVNQLLYSESVSAGYQQQALLQQGLEAGFESAELDAVLEATTTYLQALRADTQLKIQRENLDLTKTNLELARDRVRVGSASNADIYRWEANLASARQTVVSAGASRQTAYEALNRVLNQPIDTSLRLRDAQRGDPFAEDPEWFSQLIDNPRRFNWFIEYSVDEGLSRSPALGQIDAQLQSIDRDIVAKKRAYWLPDFSVQGQYTDSIDASGLGSGGVFDSVNDWNITLNASLPLYAGGARRAALSRSRLRRDQIELQRESTADRIEQNTRAAFYDAQARFVSIDLSEQGAAAARKNLELVSDSYRQGVVSIIDLLDAQNQALSADLSANNAVYDFLISIMQAQRAVSSFDFLLPEDEQKARTRALEDYIASRSAEIGQRSTRP